MAACPQDVPRHAVQVVRRVLLRRNIVIDAETAQLVVSRCSDMAPEHVLRTDFRNGLRAVPEVHRAC